RAQIGSSAPAPLSEADAAAPTDAYGRSKLAAEEALAGTGLDWVALRPVLVYGTGVKGNMAALLKLARTPYPLPLASLTGRR
ncbi:sugar nucleotide-binding protein, partial [Acinetobacter baumannii]